MSASLLSFSLGPLALPVAPLLLFAAVWVASGVAARMARGRAPTPAQRAGWSALAGNAVFHAALAGLLVARVGHVLSNAEAYLATPWALVDLRDGGWHAPAGAVAGACFLAWQAWRTPALRRPLSAAAVAGGVLWAAAHVATGAGERPPMPALVFTALDGRPAMTLAQAAQGRPVVVNLWASWCGPCRQEMPMLAAAQQRERAIGFLFVNQGESEAAVRAYLTDQDLPLREVLLDAGARLGPALGSRGLPTTLFYDAQGQLVDAHFGVLNAAALASRLRVLRAVP